MSAAVSKRRRVKKACIPCHQRKRKCDSEFPCGMCTAYEYDCRYADEHDVSTASGRAAARHASRRNSPESPRTATHSLSSRPSRGGKHSDAGDGGSSRGGGGERPTSPAGIFDEYKSRYAGASAAMAFPHVLSASLGSNAPPKIASFAYNFGIRPEEASQARCSLERLISQDDLARFSNAYITAMWPIGDLFDPQVYSQRCENYYEGTCVNSLAFGAFAAGVAALGSFLSIERHPRESELVQYAKGILDDPISMRMLTVDHIIAAGLRVFYLRATTRPNNAWIAACTLMHFCEAVGLHKEENIIKMASMPGAAALGHSADRLRRVFWIGWAGQNILSYEYDRSSVSFRTLTCGPISPAPGSVAEQFVQIGQIIPTTDTPFQLESSPSTPTEDLCERIKALHNLPVTHPFLVVTKADVVFCFYRRIYQLKSGIPNEIAQLVIDNGNAAIQAAQQLAAQGRMFWNVIGSVFQYTCVLLAMDTPAANEHVALAFESLQGLVRAADTGLTREALNMARHLLSLCTARKRRELGRLEAVEASYQDSPPQPPPQVDATVRDMAWDMDWDQFMIEPYLATFAFDV